MSTVTTGALLERQPFLDALRETLHEVEGGTGRLVLIGGEAGVGKTALVRSFCADGAGATRVLEGACDALFTPRPFAPLADVAATTGGTLAELIARDARPYEVLGALIDELHREPTVLVLEDLHWADEATLDVLRLLGRRIEGARALVIATLRDDELHATHPLRIVAGGLAAAPAVERLHLPPLTLEAVRELAARHDVDTDQLFERTGGNPFFVTEVLAAGEPEVPPTVRDAVLARASRLDPAARRLLEAVSVVPPRAGPELLEALAGPELQHLDDCLASGMLVAEGSGVAFRHELARNRDRGVDQPVRAGSPPSGRARGAPGCRRRYRAPRPPCRGGGRRRSGTRVRSCGGRACGRDGRPPRGDLPVRADSPLWREPLTRAPRRAARAWRPRVLSRRPLRRGREVARVGDRAPPRFRRPFAGRRRASPAFLGSALWRTRAGGRKDRAPRRRVARGMPARPRAGCRLWEPRDARPQRQRARYG